MNDGTKLGSTITTRFMVAKLGMSPFPYVHLLLRWRNLRCYPIRNLVQFKHSG